MPKNIIYLVNTINVYFLVFGTIIATIFRNTSIVKIIILKWKQIKQFKLNINYNNYFSAICIHTMFNTHVPSKEIMLISCSAALCK